MLSTSSSSATAPARKVIIIVLPPLASIARIHPFILDNRATVHHIIIFGVLQDHKLSSSLLRCSFCCCSGAVAAASFRLLLSSCPLWTLLVWLLLSVQCLHRTKTHYCYDK